MRSYWFALIFGLVCLSFTSLASAVSPGVVRAVADRPLVVTLEDDTVLEVEVVELGEDTVIVMDGDGNVTELDYDDITAVRVNTAATSEAAAEEAAAEEAARQEEQSVRERIEAAREREAARLEAARREADAQRETGPAGSRTGGWRESEGPGEASDVPRFYGRFGLNVGYGSLRSVVADSGDSLGLRSQGLNLGFNAALGARVMESFALHLSIGVQRFLLVSDRGVASGGGTSIQSPFTSVDYRVRMMNVGVGATFEMEGVVASLSIGAAAERVWKGEFGSGTTDWGVGGDLLVGYAGTVASLVDVGVGLSLNWVRIPEDDFGLRTGGYTIGPQFFVSY